MQASVNDPTAGGTGGELPQAEQMQNAAMAFARLPRTIPLRLRPRLTADGAASGAWQHMKLLVGGC
eukprot:scaffold3603_cov136-Isochrysis_galbana.AAC.1